MNNSLKGLRILNTRPAAQAVLLTRQIEAAGGISVNYPTLDIEAINCGWVNTLPDLNTVHYAIFISNNAVEYCFKALQQQHIVWPRTIHTIAIGKSTARALQRMHIEVHDIPEHPDSEHVLILNSLDHIKDQTLLLFKGEGGRQLMELSLQQKGARVLAIPVYKRVMPVFNYSLTNSLWHDDAVDIILLTSEQSMNHLFQLFSKEAHSWLHNKPCLVFSERLAKAAASRGINTTLISHPERVIDTLFDYYQGLIHGQQQ